MFQKGANLTSEFLYKDNEMIDIEDGIDIFELYTLNTLLHSEFTLIEEPEEIDIQALKGFDIELDFNNVEKWEDEMQIASKIDELIKAVKQLDRKIGKSNEKNV